MNRFVATFIVSALLVGCGPSWIDFYPSGLRLGQAREAMPAGKEQTLPTKVYRQYVSGNTYLQFERLEQNVLYGYLTCTDCQWQRVPLTAIHDGQHLLIATGVQDGLHTGNPDQPLFSGHDTGETNTHGMFGVVWRALLEGRNITRLAVLQNCRTVRHGVYARNKTDPGLTTAWYAEGTSTAAEGSGIIGHRCDGGASMERTFVATTDDVVGGTQRSLVENVESAERREAGSAPATPPAPGTPPANDKEAKLQEAQRLRDSGMITDEELAKMRKKILGLD